MYGHRLLIPCCIVEGEGPGLVMQLKNCFFSRIQYHLKPLKEMVKYLEIDESSEGSAE